MGGSVSTGQDNNDLIDNLLEANFIKTPAVERVFRAVDRAEYFLPGSRNNAYKDLAWKSGNLHMSAPCIYSEVLEGLCLKPGLSFLNLGSGTGYFSTMVGLILGSKGVNHGYEIFEDVIEYANRKLEIFKKHSGAIDEFDFCEPKFMQGNVLCLTSDDVRRYDRVYCGAACPANFEKYVKNLLKIDGILVVPLNNQLFQIKRTSISNFDIRPLLPVSFATLIPVSDSKQETIKAFAQEPLLLQEMCRIVVRDLLRKNIEKENPLIKRGPVPEKKLTKKKRPLRRMVVPIFDTYEDSSDDDLPPPDFIRSPPTNNDAERNTREVNGLINFVLGHIQDRSNLLSERVRNRNGANEDDDITDDKTENNNEEMVVEEEDAAIVITSGSNESSNNGCVVRAVIEPLPRDVEDESPDNHGRLLDAIRRIYQEENEEPNVEEPEAESASAEANAGAGQRPKRDKFDSGLGDEEIIEAHGTVSSDSSESADHMEFEDSSSSSSDDSRSNKRGSEGFEQNVKCRRVQFPNDSDSTENGRGVEDEIRVIPSVYTEHMRGKIQELPLPTILKKYLNFYREF